MADDLEARLKESSRAFEGLISLIPAEYYYGKDESITSTQWQRTKRQQSKEAKRAAKRAKLDPASHKSAKDVMDENARKRKREEEGDDASDQSSDLGIDVEKEKPMEGLKRPALNHAKKQKVEKKTPTDAEEEEAAADAEDAKAQARAEKQKRKQEKQKEKKAAKAAKSQQRQESKKALQQQFSTSLGDAKDDEEEEEEADDDEDEDHQFVPEHERERLDDLDVSGLIEDSVSTATPSADSNASSASIASAESSSSSIVPPTTDDAIFNKPARPEKRKIDPKTLEENKARLQAKLEALRAARKADGPDGRPARNRAELIEARRKKEAERRAARKEQWKLAKEDEERIKAEEQLARIRGGSGSPSVLGMRSRSPENSANFSFQRVAWTDGQQLDNSLSGLLNAGKKKGRSDPKTALEAAKKKQQRISAYDEDKRKDIEQKDAWINAKRRAQGEKVHDDTNLLKKSLKRQEKDKAKSSKEWKDRILGVQKGKEMRQKTRERNLAKRREEKGSKGKKGKGKSVKKPGKKVKRPGFEGTFRGK